MSTNGQIMSQIKDSQLRSYLARFINPFIAIANPYVYTKLYIESGSHDFKAVEMLQIIWDFPVLNLITLTFQPNDVLIKISQLRIFVKRIRQ